MTRQPMDHYEPERVKIDDLKEARKIGGLLRNAFLSGDDKDGGETPVIVERGSEEAHEDFRRRRPDVIQADWDPHEWRYELHVSCGEMCPVLATVPYDGDCGEPCLVTALAIARAGGLILDLAAEVERLWGLLDKATAVVLSANARAGHG